MCPGQYLAQNRYSKNVAILISNTGSEFYKYWLILHLIICIMQTGTSVGLHL